MELQRNTHTQNTPIKNFFRPQENCTNQQNCNNWRVEWKKIKIKHKLYEFVCAMRWTTCFYCLFVFSVLCFLHSRVFLFISCFFFYYYYLFNFGFVASSRTWGIYGIYMKKSLSLGSSHDDKVLLWNLRSATFSKEEEEDEKLTLANWMQL